MSETEKSKSIETFKFLSRFIELDIELKLFGTSVFKWHFPPKN